MTSKAKIALAKRKILRRMGYMGIKPNQRYRRDFDKAARLLATLQTWKKLREATPKGV